MVLLVVFVGMVALGPVVQAILVVLWQSTLGGPGGLGGAIGLGGPGGPGGFDLVVWHLPIQPAALKVVRVLDEFYFL